MTEVSAFNREMQAKLAKRGPSAGDIILKAAKGSGRGAVAVGLEFWRLATGRGKLSLTEYFEYGAFAPDLSDENRKRFISDSRHWPITNVCCDMAWLAVTEDKWLSARYLESEGIRTPNTLAVIDHSPRSFGKDRKLDSPDELLAFLKQQNFPLYGKPIRGIGSFGAFVITGLDGDMVQFRSMEAMSVSDLFVHYIADMPYLLQDFIQNHAFIAQFTDTVATLRMVNLVTKQGVKTPFVALKLPSRDNIADNFWRPGNMICDVDPLTGTIKRVRTGRGTTLELHETYPGTDLPLLGETLPYWSEILEMNRETTALHAPLRYQSQDIAITNEGPMVVEVNTGGGFDLPQLASGRGFLTDEVLEFIAECGFKGL